MSESTTIYDLMKSNAFIFINFNVLTQIFNTIKHSFTIYKCSSPLYLLIHLFIHTLILKLLCTLKCSSLQYLVIHLFIHTLIPIMHTYVKRSNNQSQGKMINLAAIEEGKEELEDLENEIERRKKNLMKGVAVQSTLRRRRVRRKRRKEMSMRSTEESLTMVIIFPVVSSREQNRHFGFEMDMYIILRGI